MTIVNTYMLALPTTGSAKGSALLAVLTEGAVSDWAVYEGIVPLAGDLGRAASAEFVANHGQKCNFERARTYFPHLPREKYRD